MAKKFNIKKRAINNARSEGWSVEIRPKTLRRPEEVILRRGGAVK